MKFFAIYVVMSDTCGNSDTYGPVGYMYADSLKKAKDCFTRLPMLTRVEVKEIKAATAGNILRRIHNKITSGEYR